ncbi:MAG: hypothetical protein CM1200mP10_29370 [Candidatus Neomarinimicrobiota bacterium]|nr:MAG: hypothetical protein CM1200mP10_29370 [Candidatus Neomarinimicrobiota bacterium]
MVAAETEAELSAAAAAARSAWGGTGASIDEGSSSLPKSLLYIRIIPILLIPVQRLHLI